MDTQLNYLAIFVAALAAFILGALWYNPAVFGKAWQKEVKLSDDDVKNTNMGMIFGTSFILYLVVAFCMAMFFGSEVDTASGALYGFYTGFGFVAMSFGINDLFEQRSLKYYFINAGYHTLMYTVMGIILGSWK